MKTKFSDLGVSKEILKALDEMGFESPTEVQEKVIEPILKKEDLIVKSKTGSGKTAAFGIPMLQQIESGSKSTQALVLTPTRELAVQVDSDLSNISKYQDIKLTSVYGQHSINIEISELERGMQVVTGTPGRVLDHITRGTLETNGIKFLILDEADKMLNMGFIEQVVKIIKQLPKERVTLLFSASMPIEIQNICWEYMRKPSTIEIASDTETVDSINQYYFKVAANEKRKQLDRVILYENPESCIIFCNTRYQVDKVNEFLQRKGYASDALHGAISQSRRLKTINKFKKGDFNFLVATDVASRGIHVNDITHVINYDVPIEMDSYVHRIGRTGRAGNGGHAITLATSDDIMSLYSIEEHINAMIVEKDLPTDEEVAEKKQATELALKSHSRARKHSHQKHKSTHDRTKSSDKFERSERLKSHSSKKVHTKSPDVKQKTNVVQPKAKPHTRPTTTNTADIKDRSTIKPVPNTRKKTISKSPKNKNVTTIVLGDVKANDNRKWVPKKAPLHERIISKLFKKKNKE